MSVMWKGLLVMGCLFPVACGSVKGNEPDAGDNNGPPAVVSIVPADNAVGVSADASIVITFSKPMDQAATQAAFQSPDIAASAAVLTWNSEGTVLTITPNAPLVYATGGDPAAVTAKKYSILVTTTAVDTAGNHLGATFMSSFHTRRRIQLQSLPMNANLSGVCYSGPSVGDGGRLITGDSLNQSVYKGLVSFSTAGLPPGVRMFEAATLMVNFDGVEGAPFPSLGAITVEAISFSARSMAFAAASHGSLGTLSISSAADVGQKTLAAVTSMADIYTNRAMNGDLAQYRLSAAVATNNNNTTDIFHFDTAPIASLAVTYTAD